MNLRNAYVARRRTPLFAVGGQGMLAPKPAQRRLGPLARVCFLYIAQPHQAPHSISAAVELARRYPEIEVDVAATSMGSLTYAQEIVSDLGGAPLRWRYLGGLMGLGEKAPPKLPTLALNLGALSRYDVIVAPERTTAALRLMGLKRQKLVYTQHGAGDRAGPFEPRLKRFDLVFAAGPKQRDRMVQEGLVTPGHCIVVGYPKFDVVDATAPLPEGLFGDDRPIVLYNPHFDRRLSSWPAWGTKVLEAFAGQDDYNLVFAPHMRLFQGIDPAKVKALRPFLGNPRIHIDLGGRACLDTTYTRMADIYLGDVSSQVYEFLRRPRPCVFLNAHGAQWQGRESYRHWRFGPVLDRADQVIDAIGQARREQLAYVDEQVSSFAYTFGRTAKSASATAADAIARLAGAKVLDPPAPDLRPVGETVLLNP